VSEITLLSLIMNLMPENDFLKALFMQVLNCLSCGNFLCITSAFGCSSALLKVAEEPAIRGIPYKKLSIGIPKETFKDERRVAIVPATVQTLVKKGFTVNVEQGAGVASSFNNQEYEAAGAKITQVKDVYSSNIVLKVCLFHVVSLTTISEFSVIFKLMILK
jgi:hypothetical protein